MAFVFFGKYDGEIIGFLLEKDADTISLVPKFSTTAHVGTVKSLTCGLSHNTPYCLTGGTDEAIRIFNLKRGQEEGTMLYHKGDVTCLAFAGNENVLSGSADHSICMWRTKEWIKLHLLGGHKDTVLSLSVHPSNRLALSTSEDKTLRLWDLIKGRASYIKKLPEVCSKVIFNPDGDYYALLFSKTIQVYKVENGELVCELDNKVGINDMCFVEDVQIAYASNDKKVHLYNIEDKSELATYVCETKFRIRTLNYILLDAPLFICGCSDGKIIIFDLNVPEKPIYEKEINGRITVCDCIKTFIDDEEVEEEDKEDNEDKEEEDDNETMSNDDDDEEEEEDDDDNETMSNDDDDDDDDDDMSSEQDSTNDQNN